MIRYLPADLLIICYYSGYFDCCTTRGGVDAVENEILQ